MKDPQLRRAELCPKTLRWVAMKIIATGWVDRDLRCKSCGVANGRSEECEKSCSVLYIIRLIHGIADKIELKEKG